MRRCTDSSRRGVALLLVLAVLLIVVTVAAGTTRLAATSTLQARGHDETLLADELLRSADAPILHWLATESGQVVLPDDVEAPVVDVLHDVWAIGDESFEMRITAWDQLGMIPLERVAKGSPLRLALPEEVRRAVDALESANSAEPGLDLFVDREEMLRAFPRADRADPKVFQVGQTAGAASSGRPDDEQQPQLVSGIGAFIATHNRDPVRINVNTAPMPLVEAALRTAGRGGLDVIRANRREGRASNAPSGSTSHRQDEERRVLIVGSSDTWAFRIDLRVNRTQRSWWCVYERGTDASRRGTPWRCVQRLLITESS